jgi:hypothetical protein
MVYTLIMDRFDTSYNPYRSFLRPPWVFVLSIVFQAYIQTTAPVRFDPAPGPDAYPRFRESPAAAV